jgi:hypothetical protein
VNHSMWRDSKYDNAIDAILRWYKYRFSSLVKCGKSDSSDQIEDNTATSVEGRINTRQSLSAPRLLLTFPQATLVTPHSKTPGSSFLDTAVG